MNPSPIRVIGKRVGIVLVGSMVLIIALVIWQRPAWDDVVPFIAWGSGALMGVVISGGVGTRSILYSGIGGTAGVSVWLSYLVPIPPPSELWTPLLLTLAMGAIAGLVLGIVARWCCEGIAVSRPPLEHESLSLNPTNKLRRWYQFSLQRMLLLFVLAGILFGTIGVRAPALRAQSVAILELRQLGGGFGFNRSWVNNVHLNGSKFRDKHLVHLASLPQVNYLSLEGSKVTDEGLKTIVSMPNLRGLRLKGALITDAGLEHLARMSGLRELNLENTLVTPTGIQRLEERLPNCKISR